MCVPFVIYIYVSMCIYMYIYIYIYVFICLPFSLYLPLSLFIYMHTCIEKSMKHTPTSNICFVAAPDCNTWARLYWLISHLYCLRFAYTSLSYICVYHIDICTHVYIHIYVYVYVLVEFCSNGPNESPILASHDSLRSSHTHWYCNLETNTSIGNQMGQTTTPTL